jgi:uncharacterized protein YjdB
MSHYVGRMNSMKISLFCISMVLIAFPAIAETYTWVDAQGTVNFTEDLGNVPARYRKKVKVLGDVELPPGEVNEGVEKPARKGKVEGAREIRSGAPAAGQDKKKTVYGGKESAAWKSEFAALDADVKAAEKQLVETRHLMQDTGGMSRTEFLTIQNTLKSLENSVLLRRKKLEALKNEAETAGVPADLME